MACCNNMNSCDTCNSCNSCNSCFGDNTILWIVIIAAIILLLFVF